MPVECQILPSLPDECTLEILGKQNGRRRLKGHHLERNFKEQ